MKAVSKFGLLLAAALMACAALAVGAQAQTINPDNTAIEGVAQNPTLNYEGTEIVCPEGTANGTTGQDSAIVDVSLTFGPPGECTIAETLPASVVCDGTAGLQATDAVNNLGIVDALNPGFLCTVTVLGVCEVTVAEQDLPSNVDGTPGRQQANLLNEGSNGDEAIDSLVDVEASSNNATCGPAQGDGGFSAVYELDTAVSFD